MTNADLAEGAARRARLAALLGRLLLAEPGPDLADAVGEVPALAPLARGTGLAADYERLLLREVPVYESVFLGDGSWGGPVVAAVERAYQRHGFEERGHWRVLGPDHLGLELRCYAALCAGERDGWAAEQPERAVRAVEAQRAVLAQHLGRWGEVAALALARRAGDGPYATVAAAVEAFLAAESERLRPDPDHPAAAPEPLEEPAPERPGPARLARFLLAPGRCGAFLDVDDLAAAARSVGCPWRPSDPRQRLRNVLEDAADSGDLGTVLAALRPTVERWADVHTERERSRQGSRRIWRGWRQRAEATLALLDRLGAPAVAGTGPAVVQVGGDDRAGRDATVTSLVQVLTAAGLRSVVHAELGPGLRTYLEALTAAGAAEVLVSGPGLSVVAQPDDGPAGEREARLLDDPDVVVRVRSTGPAAVELVDPGDDAAVATAVAGVLATFRATG